MGAVSRWLLLMLLLLLLMDDDEPSVCVCNNTRILECDYYFSSMFKIKQKKYKNFSDIKARQQHQHKAA